MSKSLLRGVGWCLVAPALGYLMAGTWLACLALVVGLGLVAASYRKTGKRVRPWQDADSRFAALVEQDNVFRRQDAGELRAEHDRRADGTWYWGVDGGTKDFRREAEHICALAGQYLTRSRKVALSPHTQRVPDDLSRWLYFLMDIGEGENDKATRIDSAGTSSSPSGEVATIYPYSIPNLVQASRNGCLKCLRLEQGGAL